MNMSCRKQNIKGKIDDFFQEFNSLGLYKYVW